MIEINTEPEIPLFLPSYADEASYTASLTRFSPLRPGLLASSQGHNPLILGHLGGGRVLGPNFSSSNFRRSWSPNPSYLEEYDTTPKFD